MHSPQSNLLIVQSENYIPYVVGDKLHIEAANAQEAGRFVAYLGQWYGASGSLRVFEVDM